MKRGSSIIGGIIIKKTLINFLIHNSVETSNKNVPLKIKSLPNILIEKCSYRYTLF